MLAAIAMCLCAVSQARQQQLAQKLIRLHVVANSDTAEDQRVKLLVRDAVLRATADVLEEETDPEAALQNGLPTIEQAANETLCRLGSGDTAKVSLRRELFPTRNYETFRLPAGVYRSERVRGTTGGAWFFRRCACPRTRRILKRSARRRALRTGKFPL